MITIFVFTLAFPVLRKYVQPLLEDLRDSPDPSPRSRRDRLF
jgi:hypothetical protein